MDTNKRFLLIFFVLVIVGTLLSVAILYFANARINSVNSYEECVRAGGAILESYPEQCAIYGKTFTNPNQTPISYSSEDNSFYGFSTKGACNIDSDCVVGGCNNEVCESSTDESAVSICIMPDKPLPSDLGYSCGCVQQKCMWSK